MYLNVGYGDLEGGKNMVVHQFTGIRSQNRVVAPLEEKFQVSGGQ
jgi:hypothetical protein